MGREKLFLAAVIILTVALCAGNALAATYPLAYDDDSSENSPNDNDGENGEEFEPAGWEWKTVLFTPAGTVKISSIDTYWADNDCGAGATDCERYRIRIYNSAGQEVYGRGWINSPSAGWNSVAANDVDLVFNQPFYVAVNAPINTLDEMNLGADVTSPVTNNSYRRVSGSFIPVTNVDYMIRVTVEDSNLPPTLTNVLDTPDPIMSNTNFFINAIGAADGDGDQLRLVCSYMSGVDDSTSECNQNTDRVPPNQPRCRIQADANEAPDTLYCKAFDGELYSAERTTTNTDDNTPPSLSLITGDNAGEDTNYDNDGTVHATLSSSDASGISSCEIDWNDGAGWQNIVPVTVTALSTTYAADGIYTVLYRCLDNVGWSSTVNDTINIDTTPPTPGILTVVGDAGNEEWDTDGNVQLSWTAATDTNGIDKYEIYRKSDSPVHGSVAYGLLATVSGATLSYDDNGLLGNTTYTYYVKAYDPAENDADTNEDFTTVDTDAPSTQITTPLDGSYTNNNDVYVEVDYANTYTVECQVRIDGGAWQPMNNDGAVSGTADYTFSGVSDGSHTITAECEDLAGLTSQDSVTFFVDTVTPVVSITLGDEMGGNDVYDNDGQVWATLSNSDPGYPATGSGVDYCQIDWNDGAGWQTISPSTTSVAYTYATDGLKTVGYRCYDKADNTGIDDDNIFVDRVAPVTTATITSGYTCNGEWYNTNVRIRLNATDPAPASGVNYTQYRINGGSWTTYTAQFWLTAEGIHTVEYRSVDRAGNVESIKTLTVRIDKTAPFAEILFPADTEHLADPQVLFTGIAYDDLGAENSSGVNQTELRINHRRWWGYNINDVVLNWTAADGTDTWSYLWDSVGNYEYGVVVRATDNACNVQTWSSLPPPESFHFFTVQDDYDYRYYTKAEIDAMILDLQMQLDGLEARVNVTEQEIISLWNNVTLVWMAIADLYEEDELLWAAINAMDARLTALEEKVHRINHGTIMLDDYLLVSPSLLIVFGEAPEGATSADIQFYDLTDNSLDHQGTVSVGTLGGNENYYELRLEDHLNVLEPKPYIIFADFHGAGGLMEGYSVSILYYGLYLHRIDNVLFGDPMACADLGLPADIYDQLQGYGIPREETVWHLIEMIANEGPEGMTYGDLCDFAEQFALFLSGHTGTTDVDEYVANMPLSHAAFFHDLFRCIGLEDELHLNWLNDMCQQQDIDALEQFTHGFNFLPSMTFETFMQSEPFTRSFTWGLNPKYDSFLGMEIDYEVWLMNYWSDNGQYLGDGGEIRLTDGCTWMQRDQWNSHISAIELPQTWPATQGEGTYAAYLVAYPCSGFSIDSGEGFPPVYYSNEFTIELDDLANPWPVYGLGTVSLNPDSDHYFGGVYWTNEPIVEMEAMLGGDTEWMNDQQCTVWWYKTRTPTGQRGLYESWDLQSFVPLAPPTPVKRCSGDIDLRELNPATRPGSSPQYDIQVCAHPIVGQVECGDTTFGYDTTPPSINFIYPGELDMLSGTVTFKVDVTDDGALRYVFLHLVNKTNGSQRWPASTPWQMNFNESSGLFELVVDTTQVPDGWYNISVLAIDYAGNEAVGVLDPLVDNTPPVVHSVWASGNYGSGFTVFAHVTDNLAGVDEAIATLRPYTCADPVEYTLTWCEEQETEQVVCAEPITDIDDECFTSCMYSFGPSDLSSPDYCEEECTVAFDSCEEYCMQYVDELSGDEEFTFEGCVEDCRSDNGCVYETETVCGFTSQCGVVADTGAEGMPVDIRGCLAYVEEYCSNNYRVLSGSTYLYEDYDECIHEETMGCYAVHCSGHEDEFPSPWFGVTNAVLVSDDDICEATRECEHKVYDCRFDTEGDVGAAIFCPPIEIVVPLSLSEGDALSGTWSGDLDGYALEKNKHYDIVVDAWDAAGNENGGSCEENDEASFFSMAGYTVSVIADVASPQYAGRAFAVRGGVTSTDGSEASGSVLLSPWSAAAPLLLGQYSASQSLSAGDDQVIVASYAPFPECDIVYTASTDVDILRAPGGSGGGGSGGRICEPEWQCSDWSECSPNGVQTRSCTDRWSCDLETGRPDEERSCAYRAPETGNSAPENVQTGGASEETVQEATGGEEPAGDEGTENLLTGAVIGATGGVFSSLLWLWILLGLIVLGLGGYFLVRKN